MLTHRGVRSRQVIVTAPFLPSQQERGKLSQQVVLTAMVSDVVGRCLAATDMARKLTVYHTAGMCLVPVSGALLLVVYGATNMFIWDPFPCIVAGVMTLICGFLYCVTNQMVLDKFPLQFSAKLMCLVNIITGVMSILAAAIPLCVHLALAREGVA